jgi:hypothetical protein
MRDSEGEKLLMFWLWKTRSELVAAHMQNEDNIPNQTLELTFLWQSDPELPEKKCRDQLHLM